MVQPCLFVRRRGIRAAGLWRKVLFYLLAFLVLGSLAGCASPAAETITVENAWARPGPAGGMSAIYFEVHNPTQQPDVLVSVSSDIAAQVQLHQSRMNAEGVMEMEHTESVEIPAGGSVAFQPGGLHVMLVGLQQELIIGQEFDLQLSFQNLGEIGVLVRVQEGPG